jgi:hypothetical protein
MSQNTELKHKVLVVARKKTVRVEKSLTKKYNRLMAVN